MDSRLGDDMATERQRKWLVHATAKCTECEWDKLEEWKLKHQRQFQHNDCSGFVFGYNKKDVDKILKSLEADNQELRKELADAYTLCVDKAKAR